MNNLTHSFNSNHVEHIGLTSSIVYQQIDSAARMLPNYALNTSLKKLHQCMPYLSETLILKSLYQLNELTIIAFEFTDSTKGDMRLVSLNDPLDVFAEDEE